MSGEGRGANQGWRIIPCAVDNTERQYTQMVPQAAGAQESPDLGPSAGTHSALTHPVPVMNTISQDIINCTNLISQICLSNCFISWMFGFSYFLNIYIPIYLISLICISYSFITVLFRRCYLC